MYDYSKAKISIHVEEQFPSFVRKEGPQFIDFIKTYYDWLERRIVLLNLKALNEITPDQLDTGQSISTESFLIEFEDEDLMAPEYANTAAVFPNEYALTLNGVDQYMEVSNNTVQVSNSWSVGLWANLLEYPSSLLSDFEIASGDAATYLSFLNIGQVDNQLHSNFAGTDIDTGIDIKQGEWNFIAVRYDKPTTTLFYDVFNNRTTSSFSTVFDLSGLNSNNFVLGADLYSGDHFFSGLLDEVSTWDKCLSNSEIIALYNDGTPIDLSINSGNYTSNTNLQNWWRFDTGNTSVALNSANVSRNGTLIHDPLPSPDTPFNLAVFITEHEETLRLSLNVLSYINYSGGLEGEMSNRMLLFAEHIYGKLENDTVIYSSPDNKIQIDSFTEAKTPLNVCGSLCKYQNIDTSFVYDNFISNEYFQHLMYEIQYGFPLFLHPKFDSTIKPLLGKTIKEFYRSKGTAKSIAYLFKILYNEDLDPVTDIYSDGPYSYVIKTRRASSVTLEYVKKLVHPIGYNVTLEA